MTESESYPISSREAMRKFEDTPVKRLMGDAVDIASIINDQGVRETAMVGIIDTYAMLVRATADSGYVVDAREVLAKIPTDGLSRLHHIEALTLLGVKTNNNTYIEQAVKLATDKEWAQRIVSKERRAAKAEKRKYNRTWWKEREVAIHQKAHDLIDGTQRNSTVDSSIKPQDPNQAEINQIVTSANQEGAEIAVEMAKAALRQPSTTDRARLITIKGIQAIVDGYQTGRISESTISIPKSKDTPRKETNRK